MTRQDRANQRSEKLHIGNAKIGRSNAFDYQSSRDAVRAEPAERLRQIDPDQSNSTHLPYQRWRNVALLFARHIARRELFDAEAPGGLANLLLLGGKGKVQPSAPT